ncbi:hypothetical protein NDU88_004081 [Pleurodeles waltl]|uniref:Uncharacterized protein n=1 Tax=Pleurodeles waltl TaxID=8319 RepID=A0AAV7VF85_PLEWA|nr:hypothetical protein NDU88_004081 [Pleurodeles waltl]
MRTSVVQLSMCSLCSVMKRDIAGSRQGYDPFCERLRGRSLPEPGMYYGTEHSLWTPTPLCGLETTDVSFNINNPTVFSLPGESGSFLSFLTILKEDNVKRYVDEMDGGRRLDTDPKKV